MNYLINTSTDPYFNMSFDEYCLERLPSDDCFFYLWRNRPSVILGLNQNAYGEVNLPYLREHGISLARRVTGGGAVYHDLQNMNYTFIGPHVSSQPFVDALVSLGVPAELTGRNDIHVEGRKVSGYARRVWHDREIVHGTMMYDVDIQTLVKVLDVPGSKLSSKGIASVSSRVANLKDYLPQFASLDELQAELGRILAGPDGHLFELDATQLAEVQKCADEKFSTWDWIYGHSHEADFVRKAKLACGNVEVSVSLDHGFVTAVSFGGDFLGDLPAAKLAPALVGVRFDAVSVQTALEAVPVGRFFDGVDAAQLTDLIING